MKNLRFSLMFFLSLLLAQVSHGQSTTNAAWKTTHNSWLEETSPGSGETWEDLYSKWVKVQVTPFEFTAEDSDLYGIKTDCADSVYAIRMLFAYQNGLPFAVEAGNRSLLTNEAPSQGGSPRERFQSFVRKVVAMEGTASLSRDTYPISISRDYVTPGKILLYFSNTPGSINHSHTLTNVSTTGVMTFLSATETEDVQVLMKMMKIADPPYTDGDDGLRAWRHYLFDPQTHEYRQVSLSQEPGSKEFVSKRGEPYIDQFDRSIFPRKEFEWGNAITEKIGLSRETPMEELTLLFKSLCESVAQREDVIVKGSEDVYKRKSCANENQWEKYSTVKTDEVIWYQFQAVDNWVRRYRPLGKVGDDESFRAARDARDRLFRTCTLGTIDDHFDLRWVRQAFKNHINSQDPADAPLSRWGYEGGTDFSVDPNKSADFYDEDWPTDYDHNIVSRSNCRQGTIRSSAVGERPTSPASGQIR